MVVTTNKVPLYRQKLILIAYTEGKELLDWVKEKYGHSDLGVPIEEFDAGFFEWDGIQHLVFDVSSNITPGIIAHECKHAVNNLFSLIKQHLDCYNDEAECYLLQWYVDHTYQFLEDIK